MHRFLNSIVSTGQVILVIVRIMILVGLQIFSKRLNVTSIWNSLYVVLVIMIRLEKGTLENRKRKSKKSSHKVKHFHNHDFQLLMLINLCIEIEKIEHFFGHVTHSNYFYMFYNRHLFTSGGNKCFFDIYSKGYYKSISG